MFVIVKSGDEQERLFNTNCQIDALLRDISTRCPHKVEDEGKAMTSREVYFEISQNLPE